MISLRGVYIIWLRDIKRFLRDRARIIAAMAQPALYLFVLGTGLGAAIGRSGDYIKFIYPGIIGMTLLFTSIFSAISIVWDREFGFLKEILVAPISRSTVALGKAFGGSTIAMIQGTMLLIFAPFVGVSLSFLMVLKLFAVMFLIAFSLTSMGIVVAARLKTMEGFQMIMNFLMMPLFLLSGAMFPLKGLPEWMNFLVKMDPLTYGIDALRYIVIGIHSYSLPYSLVMVLSFGAVMISFAIYAFNRQN
ncbi:MAG: ABC transporter permease [Actinobacteria bacterium]|nr:ABC transporter permease [Actinomycetota bacterium]